MADPKLVFVERAQWGHARLYCQLSIRRELVPASLDGDGRLDVHARIRLAELIEAALTFGAGQGEQRRA